MKHIPFYRIAKLLFDEPAVVKGMAEVLRAVLQARSARWTEIAAKMRGSEAAAYKRLQRLMERVDPREVLLRLFAEQSPFVLGDPTEIERPEARKTSYVGYLKKKRRGFWALILGVPFRGRAIPFHLVTYSSRTIEQEVTSRNRYHFRAFAQVKEIIGERPLVLDREFSYLELFKALVAEGIHFVIRLNLGSHPPRFTNAEGEKVNLHILPGQKVIWRGVFYQGQVEVNLIGVWKQALKEPLWIITDLEPEEGLKIYRQRMKIEQSFRDLKSLLGVRRVMNQRQDLMEKTLALVTLAYVIGLLTGEMLRDLLYGGGLPSNHHDLLSIPARPGKKWYLYSGLFILLKKNVRLPRSQWLQVANAAYSLLRALVLAPT